MSRVMLIFALVFGVTAVDAAPKKSSSSETKKKRKKKKKEVDDRRPNKRTKANMPLSFVALSIACSSSSPRL